MWTAFAHPIIFLTRKDFIQTGNTLITMGERAEEDGPVKGHSFLIENLLSRDDRPDIQEPKCNQPTDNEGLCSCSDNGNSPDCDFKIRHKKKTRTVFSRHQIFYLESAFEMKRYLSSTERSEMARTLKLTETQVKVWFQNRRNKWKSQVNGHETPESPIYPHYSALPPHDPRLHPRLPMFHQLPPFYY